MMSERRRFQGPGRGSERCGRAEGVGTPRWQAEFFGLGALLVATRVADGC